MPDFSQHTRRPPIPELRQLLLMRHAKSSWDDARLSDHARPLNTRGRMAALAMRAAMRDLGLSPDLVLVSSARRTLQTLEALEPWEGRGGVPRVEPMDALYLAPPDELFDVLNRVSDDMRSVLLLGHNPGIHDLALALLGPRAENYANPDIRRLGDAYPTGALAEFTIRGTWQTLAAGDGELTRFLSPRDLPDVAG